MPSPWLPVMILVIVGIVFAMLTRRVAHRIGHSPNSFGAGDTAHDFVGRVYRVCGAILFIFLIARGIAPEIDTAAGLIQVLARPAITWLGLAVMTWGGVAILAAQAGIGASWRIGLGQKRTGLVTSGLFAWSRNPTFLSMVAVVLGAFLVAPTAVTGIVLAVAWVTFSVQIRMEEEHLHRMHGRAYEAYRAAVPRWIGLPRSPARAPATQGQSVDRV
ncbi:methyltransferase family protein [Microvirga tunisiensis]|uniref:Isoprenylcysteine carboxylmethyltransferase family protein n=1 Tax=Microvirga tunisiensis TaxID=2108360 RepID=A0A5N7MPX9_9HYPH|nr:isoprenylcysteine carboxylmethyltransferase family protein [Microvirga tunisiensis]MPR10930.1 isoprenylcysteine carboxylmethyltransferase family protein [Microvirga tunisiensis]MPR29081.1 isoprenylcysteine carboxylmethyltransferase family protein [Microvirga tunisiensis]